tara:strand:- start:3429 stop:4526 length:1098 start_codon:yes stop_codon:yes gene_type:complete
MSDKYGRRLRLSPEEVEFVYQKRASTLENINDNTALDTHLKERGIEKKDVVSVKHWQSANGEYRFSVVTKEDYGLDEGKIFAQVNEFIEGHSPSYSPIRRKEDERKPHLFIFNPADIHIGKYANELETGDGYDCETAVKRVLDGMEGILQKTSGFNIDRIKFDIGNDVLHIDNVYSTTTKGTFVDSIGKWWEHFEIALSLYVACVERLREIAPVDVVHSMSNHDYQSGFHLAHALQAWFRNASDITFDISVAHRKYYRYGLNLIGTEHGDGAKLDQLPLLMAQESPKMWSETQYRYFYVHHLHHKIKWKWQEAKDYTGVVVEYLRSPSSPDSWHSRKGFSSTQKAVEGFLHDKESGQVARLTHYF